MKNILVIGATGFVGRNIILDLVKNYNVYALIRFKKKKFI